MMSVFEAEPSIVVDNLGYFVISAEHVPVY